MKLTKTIEIVLSKPGGMNVVNAVEGDAYTRQVDIRMLSDSRTLWPIPEGVTSIDNYAFRYCYGVRYYDFSACTSVPTLTATSAFIYIPADCEMLIPAALYDEWSTATNWATYAKYMVAV